MRRIIAMSSVIIIVFCVIGALICAIIGSPYFWALFFLAMTLPVLMWVFLWFLRLMRGEDHLFEPLDMDGEQEDE